MSTITKYAKTITQTAGSRDRKFSNLANMKKSSGYAVSESLIAGKNGTHNNPSALTFINFGISLPTGAEVTSIKVEYAHQKVAYQGGVPNIPAPNITLVGGFTSTVKKGKTPTTSMVKGSVSWTNKTGVSSTKITSGSFGVKLDYPANANTNPGYLRVQYVRVIVTYKSPSYSFSLSGKGAQSGEEVTIKATINNKAGTKYNPTVNIKLPTTITYKSKSGDGTITNKGSGNLVWNPKITSKTKSRSVSLTVQLGSVGANNVIKISEPTTKASKQLTLAISEIPPQAQEDETYSDETPLTSFDYSVQVGEEFEIDIDPDTLYPERTQTTNFRLRTENITDKYIVFKDGDNWEYGYLVGDETQSTVTAKATKVGVSVIDIWAYYPDDVHYEENEVLLKKLYVQVIPDLSNITTPCASIMHLEQEELDRLGDGYNYTVQSYLKVITSELYPHDWGKNYRIGIFNNRIESNITQQEVIDEETEDTYQEDVDSTDYGNLTTEDIVNNAEWWSLPVSIANSFQSLSVDFTYEEDYPLYIIFTSDYKENQLRSVIEHTTPVIVEDDEFKGFEATGNYPVPINSAIIPTDDVATLIVPEMQIATPIIAYQLPLADLDEMENTIVKGIEISLDVDYTDSAILSCKLRNHNGIIGERSVSMTSLDDNTIVLGDSTDKWGFKASELAEFEKWEIELQVNNLFDNEMDMSTILFDNLTMTLHTTTINPELVSCLVDGELLSAYGAFLLDVEIPAGLETETKYINIDGTDTNDAYRQNIKEKEIKLKFSIDGCTLEESTLYLQEITKLLMNERNNLNNPIEKRIEFSHYPGIYWEYIMEKAISAPVDVVGYECEATLTVPAGTAFSDEEIVTGTTGRVNGLAKINPIIVAINPDGDTIKIDEEYSGQSFTLVYDFQSSDIIEIDCINRKVILKRADTETDITGYTDYSADWFKIMGEYSFSANGCIIQTITRTERR